MKRFLAACLTYSFRVFELKTPVVALSILIIFSTTAPARAEFEVCNVSDSDVAVSLAYSSTESWISEGWWEILPDDCLSLIEHDLQDRFYYLFGVDLDTGHEWSGDFEFCVGETEFTIFSQEDCDEDGYYQVGGMEIDTGGEDTVSILLE